MIRKVFISHKNTGSSNEVGEILGGSLIEIHGKDNIFFDKFSLEGGMNWNSEIINNLLQSDVVIVIVDKETAESHWVQREIDMARAQFISILPVALDKYADVEPAFKRFDIQETQFISYPESRDPNVINATIKDILSQIESLSVQTINNQQKSFEEWQTRRTIVTPKKTPGDKNPAVAKFRHPTDEKLIFQIACGDASQVKSYDVLVNTENNYMQMARFFEKSTLSYAIRTNGAFFEDGVVLTEDTIQDELYENAKAKGGLPVRDGRVLVTSAGHKKSRTQRFTDFRYAFHVAAVRVSVKDRSVQPIDDVDRFIINCIDKIETLDLNQGAIELRDEEFLLEIVEDYAPIESILFPAFGAGEGGKSLTVAIDEIVKCFARDVPNLINNLDLNVNKIGLSIYFEEDVELVKQIFLSYDFQEIGD